MILVAAPPLKGPLYTESPPSFERVYAEHFDFVWRCLQGLGVSASLLDDAAQDVFVVVHRRLPGYEGRSSLRTWLYGVVRNVAFKQRRRRQQQRRGGWHGREQRWCRRWPVVWLRARHVLSERHQLRRDGLRGSVHAGHGPETSLRLRRDHLLE